MLSANIKIGDKLACLVLDKAWKGLSISLFDTVECTHIDYFCDGFEVTKFGIFGNLKLYLNSTQLNAMFIPFIPVNSLPTTTLPPSGIQYIPPSLPPPSLYSIGDILILNQWNQSFPAFVANGDVCIINRVTSQPFVLFDLNHLNSNRYIGSFSEKELFNWFTRFISPTPTSTQPIYRTVGDSLSIDIAFIDNKIKECDCGAKTTYGVNCNEFSHSTWCEILKKD